MSQVTLKPFWQSGTARLLCCDVRQGLRSLPAESVHCVVSSPPYLGLRDYGTPPQVWGGEPQCQHVWQERHRFHASPRRSGAEGPGFHRAEVTRRQRWSRSHSCPQCGAWRGELGLETEADCLAWARKDPPCGRCYVCHIRSVFAELWRVLHPSGTVWWNLADSFNGSGGAGGDYGPSGRRAGQLGYPGRHLPGLKPKDLVGIPWRTALAVQADGWYLRSSVIWAKPNGLPESVRDRPVRSHEYVLLLAKRRRYFYDADAVREPLAAASLLRARHGRGSEHKWAQAPERQTIAVKPPPTPHPLGRSRRDVWSIPSRGFRGAHFATFPEDLVEPCISAGTSEKGCCPNCLAPWRRISARGAQIREWQRQCGANLSGGYAGEPGKAYQEALAQDPAAVKRRILEGLRERLTLGWEPICNCSAGTPVPCTVLDPFTGSGATGAVATRLNRTFIGIELKEQYCRIARDRIGSAAGPASATSRTAANRPPAKPRSWRLTRDGDPHGLALYQRHYSARHYKDGRPRRLFVGPGEKLVLITESADALLVWRKFKSKNQQTGVNCALFRNEGSRQSSALIREGAGIAWERWPGERLYTYVNPRQIQSPNPGYCFKQAGWQTCGKTNGGLIVLEALP